MTEQQAVTTAILGGEVRQQGGLSNPTRRTVVLGALVIVASLLGGQIGAGIGIVLAAVVFVLTLSNGGDRSVAHNWQARRRWHRMTRNGYDVFRPVADRPVNCTPKSKDWNSYRDFPDGVDEWELLTTDPEDPAIQYHFTPDGERYLAATFRVDGQLVGLAGDDELEIAQTRFGELLAGWGARGRLVSGIQITTRMLRPNTVSNQAWMRRQLDLTTPESEINDYDALLTKLTAGRFVQRHYVTLRWDRTARFNIAAKEYGVGAEGWTAVVSDELRAAQKRCRDAGYTRVEALTGPQHAALIRHLQNPDYHPDETADVTVAGMYRPSVSQFDRVITDEKWTHLTAKVPVEAIETGERDGMWMWPLLIGMEQKLHRTLVICIRVVPAADAKRSARRDASKDTADQIADKEKGRLDDDETAVSLSAAHRRVADMRPGTGHHGTLWTAYLTISVPKGELVQHAVTATEDAADAAGVNRLDWCNSYQAAAQSYTWPTARGVVPDSTSRGSRVLETLSIRSAAK